MEFPVSDVQQNMTDQEFMRLHLQTTLEDSFVKAKDKQRSPGNMDDHFDQYYKGIKIDGGGYNFHYQNGKMFYANGHYLRIKSLDATPGIEVSSARDLFASYKNIPADAILISLRSC